MPDWPRPGTPPAFARVSRATSQTITPTTQAAISFSTEVEDTDNMVDIAGQPTRVTINSPGVYVASFAMRVDTVWSSASQMLITMNAGANVLALFQGLNSAVLYNVLTMPARRFVKGDYLQAQVFNASGSTLTVVAAVEYGLFFAVHRVA